MPVATEVTTLEGDQVRIDVTVPEDEVRKQFDRTVREASARLRVPGFRPGKVPAGVVISRIGREGLFAQTIDRALNDWYREALALTGVDPLESPDVDLGDATEQGVTFAVTIKVPPVPVLGEYKGLEVMREADETPEGAAEEEIRRVREQAARLEDKDAPAADGDFLIIDLDGTLDGQALPDAATRGQLIELGGDRILPEFTAGLAGATAGDQVTIAVEYAEDDTRDEIRGRTVEYSVTIQKVQEKVLPEVDDALAESVGFASADEMRAEIDQRLASATAKMVEERYRRRAIDAAADGATFDVSPVMVDRRIDSILHDTSHQLPKGVTLEQFLAMQGQTVEQARESLRADAEMSIRRELVVEAIADAEGITLTDEEVEARVRADAADAGRDVDELLTALRTSGGWDSLRQDLRVERAVDFIVQSATPISAEEAAKREEAAAAPPPAPVKKATTAKAAEPAAAKPAVKKATTSGTAASAKASSGGGKAATPAAKGSGSGAAKKPPAAGKVAEKKKPDTT